MKVFKVLMAVALVASMLVMPTLAANFVPSVEVEDKTYLIRYTLDEVDTPCRTVLLIPYDHLHLEDLIDEEALEIEYAISEEMEQDIRDSLTAAKAELEDSILHHLIPDFDKEWEEMTGGAPLENATVYDLFEIVLICSEADAFMTNEKITVYFKVDGIGPEDQFLIAHKPTDSEEWILEDYEIDERGVIKMTVDKLSPFAIITDNGEGPADSGDAPDSPKTGVQAGTYLLPMIGCAVIALGAVYGIRKSGKHAA